MQLESKKKVVKTKCSFKYIQAIAEVSQEMVESLSSTNMPFDSHYLSLMQKIMNYATIMNFRNFLYKQ
jgi:hypothetical protein